MKITRIYVSTSHIVETVGELYPTYRRFDSENWENLMGESWEPIYNCEKLEAEFQQFLLNRKEVKDNDTDTHKEKDR